MAFGSFTCLHCGTENHGRELLLHLDFRTKAEERESAELHPHAIGARNYTHRLVPETRRIRTRISREGGREGGREGDMEMSVQTGAGDTENQDAHPRYWTVQIGAGVTENPDAHLQRVRRQRVRRRVVGYRAGGNDGPRPRVVG